MELFFVIPHLIQIIHDLFFAFFIQGCSNCFHHLVKISALQDDLARWKSEYETLKSESEEFKQNVMKFLNNDQIKALKNPENQIKNWGSDAVKKAIMVKSLGGSRSLSFCRKYVAPLPSNRTILRHLEDFKVSPGILHEVIDMINMKVSEFSETQCHMGILLDEKAIVPGSSMDRKTKEYYGKCTLPESDQYADNVLVFLLVGIEIRIKDIVGIHFTDKKNNSKEQADFLMELISVIEIKTSIKIDFVVFDLGPANTGMLKQLQKSLVQSDKEPWICHPNDPFRRLFLIPDAEHCLKNLVSALRNHGAKIPKNFVEKYQLSSGKICLKEVSKLVKIQQESTFKPAPKLTSSILAPTHFQKMATSTFEHLISNDVTTALEFLSKESQTQSDKKNPTCWLLMMLNEWRQITAYQEINFSDINHASQFESLMEMADLLESIKFGERHLPCQNGACWTSIAIIQLSTYYHSIGMKTFKPSRVLQNALESVFSIIASYQSNPSAYDVIQAIKKITVAKFLSDPIRGSYKWDSDTNFDSKVCFIDYLKEKKKSKPSESFQNSDIMDVEIPESINSKDLFKTELESQTFYAEISRILLLCFSHFECQECLNEYSSTESNIYDQLLKLRSISLDKVLKPSPVFISFCYKIEHIFRQLDSTQNRISTELIKLAFKNIVSSKIPINFNHCKEIFDFFVKEFIQYRLKISYNLRFADRKQLYASKFK